MESKYLIGAKARVFLASNLDLHELATYLGSEVLHVEFYFETDMDPPHAEVAMCEVLGFELWLKRSQLVEGCDYELQLETSNCHDAVMGGRMSDLSPWLKQYLSEMADLKVVTL